MKILLDECVDQRLAAGSQVMMSKPSLKWVGRESKTAISSSWPKSKFEVFVAVDRNLSFQQNLSRYNIAVLVLRASTNRFRDLRLLVPELLTSLSSAKLGEVLVIDS